MEIITPVIIKNGVILRNRENCYMVGRLPIKNERIYKLKSTQIFYDLHKLIIKYGNNLPDQKIIFSLIKDIKEYDINTDLPNKIFNYKAAVNEIIEAIYEVFPHPYHI